MALALGMTVAELLARISSAELSEWQAYTQLEPFGAARDDYRSAMLASVMVNLRGGESVPADFMPDFITTAEDREAQEERERQERLREKILALNALFGGSDLRKTDNGNA